jgi:6-phosphogluconolactonase
MKIEEDSIRVIVAAEEDEWSKRAADHFATAAREAIAARGTFHVVVPGGSTPRLAFRRLVAEIKRDDPLWSSVHVYFGDERLVSPDHPDSNYLAIREAWLDHVSIPEEQIHRIAGELEPEEAARRYSGVVGAFLRGGGPTGREFDLLVLGLGPDGHVASLIPRGKLDFVADGLVGIGPAPASPARVRRITLTTNTLRSSREVVFWVRGRDKAEAVRGALRGGMETMVPEVVPPDVPVTWILDRGAASRLDP